MVFRRDILGNFEARNGMGIGSPSLQKATALAVRGNMPYDFWYADPLLTRHDDEPMGGNFC